MKKNLSDKQVQAYQLVSGEFEGLSTDEAAKRMKITPQAINRLLSRANKSCPQLFPILTKQEADVKTLLAKDHTNADMANQLQVSLGRISQIIGSINEKQGTTCGRPVKIIPYHPYLDSQIVRKF